MTDTLVGKAVEVYMPRRYNVPASEWDGRTGEIVEVLGPLLNGGHSPSRKPLIYYRIKLIGKGTLITLTESQFKLI